MNRLSLRRGPVRLVFSRDLWAGAWFLIGAQFVGLVLGSIALTAMLTGAAFAITLAGIPLAIAAVATIRWCANRERARLRRFCGDVGSGYRQFAGSGMLARARAEYRDPAIWRDIAYLVGMYLPLGLLDVLVLTLWGGSILGIALPAWYWAPWQDIHGVRYHGYQLGYFPNGPHGHPGYGLYVDTLPKALLAAAAFLILFVAFSYVLMATARMHVNVARNLLGAPVDPLREEREVLGRPGPLSTSANAAHPDYTGEFSPNER